MNFVKFNEDEYDTKNFAFVSLRSETQDINELDLFIALMDANLTDPDLTVDNEGDVIVVR